MNSLHPVYIDRWDRAVRKIALIFLSLSVLAPVRALAGDWSAKAIFRQGVEINDNRDLRPNAGGETYEFASELFLSTVARLPGLRIEANADVSYRTLAGAGSDDFDTPMNNGANVRIEKVDRLTKYFLSGAFRQQDAVSAQIADTGVILAKGDISTYTIDTGFLRQVSALDAVSWSIRGTSVDLDYVTPGTSPYLSVTTTGAWIKQLSPTSRMTSSLQFEMLDREAPADSETVFVRAMLGFESQLTKRLSLRASAGGGVHRTNHNGGVGPQPTETSESWLGDLQLTYNVLAGTQLSLFAFQKLAPSIVGEVQNRAAVGASMRQALNHASYLLLSAEFNHTRTLEGLSYGDADYFRASATYGYRLTPEWSALLSYRFAQRHDDEGPAHSNAIFLSAVRDLTIMP